MTIFMTKEINSFCGETHIIFHENKFEWWILDNNNKIFFWFYNTLFQRQRSGDKNLNFI